MLSLLLCTFSSLSLLKWCLGNTCQMSCHESQLNSRLKELGNLNITPTLATLLEQSEQFLCLFGFMYCRPHHLFHHQAVCLTCLLVEPSCCSLGALVLELSNGFTLLRSRAHAPDVTIELAKTRDVSRDTSESVGNV